MPDDIHESMWKNVAEFFTSGVVAVTAEIYEEMCHITGIMGDCIRANEDLLVYEIEDPTWDWQRYVEISRVLQLKYADFIAENRKNPGGTVGRNDISIIALAKVLDVPLVSSEQRVLDLRNSTKRKIPNICDSESIEHLDWNEFLRRESMRF
jgi:hypothetical protein